MEPAVNNGKRLDHVQAIIQRLAGNSFSIKGWAIAITSAFLGFGVGKGSPHVAYVGIIPCAMFWLVDAYYLASERHFRLLYNDIASGKFANLEIHAVRPTLADLWRSSRAFILVGMYGALILSCALVGWARFSPA